MWNGSRTDRRKWAVIAAAVLVAGVIGFPGTASAGGDRHHAYHHRHRYHGSYSHYGHHKYVRYRHHRPGGHRYRTYQPRRHFGHGVSLYSGHRSRAMRYPIHRRRSTHHGVVHRRSGRHAYSPSGTGGSVVVIRPETASHSEVGESAGLAHGWRAIREGRYRDAQTSFAKAAVGAPGHAEPKLGYALSAALQGNDEVANYAIQRVHRYGDGVLDQPHPISGEVLDRLIHRYQYEDTAEAERMLAALRRLRQAQAERSPGGSTAPASAGNDYPEP